MLYPYLHLNLKKYIINNKNVSEYYLRRVWFDGSIGEYKCIGIVAIIIYKRYKCIDIFDICVCNDNNIYELNNFK